MKPTIRLGRWFGVPVGLHYSWFIIAAVIALSLTSEFAATNPAWPPALVWALALIAAVLFFGSLVLHELAHATVARIEGIPVRGITLFALGGVAQIEKDAATAGKEFRMAVAGPLASLGIGLVCRALAAAAGWAAPSGVPSAAAAVLGWLAYINVALALFNLTPGFPLDGGRVLRSIVWAITGDGERATRIAARGGQLVAIVFIGGGLLYTLRYADAGGLWIAFIGWFLLEGATGYYAQSVLAGSLADVRVSDVMSRDCGTVNAATSLQRFVEDQLMRAIGRCFAVERDHRLVGLIAPEDVTHVDRERWSRTTVEEAMRPLQSLHPVAPETSANEALEIMGREHVAEVPVVAGGHLEGLVSWTSLLRLLRTRRQLRA
ncbi:MAG TPA: site-2 protease family protein [Vicinamibacterales bacterium]|nr:site-2 protease family protein [Vicinamibacterales bacterium]